jgi:hypothetical protein
MAGSTIPLPPTGLIKRYCRLIVIDLHWLLDGPTTKSASMPTYTTLGRHRLYTHQSATVSRCSVPISSVTLLTAPCPRMRRVLGTQPALRSVDGDTMDTGRSHRVSLPLQLAIEAYHFVRAVCSSHNACLSYAHPYPRGTVPPLCSNTFTRSRQRLIS